MDTTRLDQVHKRAWPLVRWSAAPGEEIEEPLGVPARKAHLNDNLDP